MDRSSHHPQHHHDEQGFLLDPALGGHTHIAPMPDFDSFDHHHQHPQQQQQQPQASPAQPSQPHHPDDLSLITTLPLRKRKAPSSTGAGGANEDESHELRRIANENVHLSTSELADRLRAGENGQHAEKERQVFGVTWYANLPCCLPLLIPRLLQHCETSPEANVPRNRIYARYVGVCANERVKPLNPASFGKLVRMVFPDIKTRRLGVRGQSKYHYCGVGLRGEDGEQPDPHEVGALGQM